MRSKKKTDFEGLAGRIQAASDALQQDALVVINRSVTARAWLTGYYIVEYEQHGADRAKYGEGLFEKLAARLNDDKFRLSSLKSYRQFFRVYPELAAPVRAYLVSRFGGGCALPKQIGQTLYGLSDSSQILLISGDEVRGNPFALFNRISFSHIIELLKMPVEMMRTFYAFEAIRGTWSVRALRRQIESQYYQRVGWAKNPHKLAALAQGRAEKLNANGIAKSNNLKVHSLCEQLPYFWQLWTGASRSTGLTIYSGVAIELRHYLESRFGKGSTVPSQLTRFADAIEAATWYDSLTAA